MATYHVPLTTWADATVTVETDETDPEKIVDLAMEQVSVSLCHHCSGNDGLTLGDTWEPVQNDGKPEVYKVED